MREPNTPVRVGTIPVALFVCLSFEGYVGPAEGQEQSVTSEPIYSADCVPVTWDETKLATSQIPLAHRAATPKHIPRDAYTALPVRPIYQSYDVYRPDQEPSGYFEWLKRQEPVIVWDATITPRLETRSDWIQAGELVFDASLGWGNGSLMGPYEGMPVRDLDWYRETEVPLTQEGKLPFYRYVIRKKGLIEVTRLACAQCHTRVMSDGSVVKGAQGNFPFGKASAYDIRKVNDAVRWARPMELMLYGAPWLRPDPLAELTNWSVEQIAAGHERVPPGVLARHGSGVWSPVPVPDLIGLKDRKYFDRTGLNRHREIGDLMRYIAMNQDTDGMALHGEFRPIAAFNPVFRKELPPPQPADMSPGGRYSDTQLYALAIYLYSLTPPPNPHLPKSPSERAQVARGKAIFERLDCARCHSGAIFSSNKLTPVDGFTVLPSHFDAFEIEEESVGTDTTLALKTRRGTGFYKIPPLNGLWYRGPLEHNGSVATLEDWFDSRRTADDYEPTGWKGPTGTRNRAVPGHYFGLDLNAQDRQSLIAFLRTL